MTVQYDVSYDEEPDPYDPDMTVDEALRRGLIAIIDTGSIRSASYGQACGMALGPAHPSTACTRAIGHPGVCANVLRWNPDPNEELRRLRLARANWARGGYASGPLTVIDEIRYRIDAKIADLEAKIEADRKTQEYLREKRERAQQRALEENSKAAEAARAMGKQLAAQQKALAEAWEKMQAATTSYVAASEKSEERMLNRLDSMVAKPTKQPTWADIQRTSKRKAINPKGQR